MAKAARYLLREQMPEGGWNNYPDGPPELGQLSSRLISLSNWRVTIPTALLCGRARAVIRSLGGAADCNSFTKFYLAPARPVSLCQLSGGAAGDDLFAQMGLYQPVRDVELDADDCRAAEHFLRAQAVRRLPPELGIGELFLQPPETPLWPASAHGALVYLDQLLPGSGQGTQVVESVGGLDGFEPPR